ncbi:MAG: type II toxin-antitoxin system RelE family toxin [Acidimicrobiia bacterium]
MAGYEIEIEPKVLKEIAGIPAPDIHRVRDRIRSLSGNPRPAGCEKLTGTDGFRVRQGSYRIVYRIDDAARVVTITRVGPRGDVYRRR